MMKTWINRMGMTVLGLAAGLAMTGCESFKPDGGGCCDEDAKAGDCCETKEAAAGKDAQVDFLTEVKPVLEYYCLRCHNTGLLLGDLNLETRKLALASGDSGPMIVPGHPEASKFYQVLKLQQGTKQAMPPEKHRLSKEQRDLIYRWIKQGAEWPADSRGTLKPLKEMPEVAMAEPNS